MTELPCLASTVLQDTINLPLGKEGSEAAMEGRAAREKEAHSDLI
jgi:hypothetical protein